MLNKKYLLNEIQMLIEQNKELQTKINLLNKSIQERDVLIESLNSNAINKDEISELYNTINSMKSLIDDMTLESVEDKDKIKNLILKIEENSLNNQPGQAKVAIEQGELSYNNNDENFVPIEFGDEINYASAQIGKVIVKISDFCNNMVSNSNQNARELINLALGRGEVFKSDVMTVLQSNSSFNEKANIIQDKIKDVDSYIISLYGQL